MISAMINGLLSGAPTHTGRVQQSSEHDAGPAASQKPGEPPLGTVVGKSELTPAEQDYVTQHLEDLAHHEDAGQGPLDTGQLTEEEQQQVEKLKQRDAEVRRHEQAHKTAAGGLATGGPTYQYETGPDGHRYAVGGEVNIDVSPEDDPQKTIQKMQQVRRAALAPAQPSSQDRQVAARAAAEEQKARAELAKDQRDPEASDEPGQLIDLKAY